MARPGLQLGPLLRAWQTQNEYTDQQAADQIGISYATYKGWKGTRAVGPASLPRVYKTLGAASYAGLVRRYGSPELFAEVHRSVDTNSEDIFLSYLNGTKELRETRLMRKTYRPYDSGHRKTLGRLLYDRLCDGDITTFRVEQFLRFDRLVDVMWNIKRFGHVNYQVRVIPRTDFWFSYPNLTIFDARAVMVGGFHNGAYRTEQFMDYMGRPYVEFFRRIWDLTWESSSEFSMLDERDRNRAALSHARSLPEYGDLTLAELELFVAERGRLAADYPTRY